MHRWEDPKLASTMFGAILHSREGGSGGGRFATATLLALGIHAAVLLALGVFASTRAGASTPTGARGDTPELAVQFMVPRASAPSSSSTLAMPRQQLASRPAPVRRRLLQPKPLPPVAPPVVERSEARPEPVDVGGAGTEATSADVAGSEAGSGGGGVLGGVVGGHLGGPGGALPPPPPPELTLERRQVLTSRYLQELFRSRIASHFQYPAEAESLGLEGLVTVRVFIDRGGQLLGTRVQGPCPHALLCDAALRTVRESVPLPPPPAELGGSVAVDVPFQYRLE